MRPGAVLVDVAIDQGGCFETSHPDDALRSDVRRRRRRPLLRGEHARRGADQLDAGTHQRDASVPRARGRSWLRARNRPRSRARAGGQRRRRPGHLAASRRGARPFRSSRLPTSSAKRRSQSVKKLPSRGLERAGIGPRKKEKSMSSDTSRTYRRPHLGRMRRAALTAVAVVVGAIVLSGCVVIQSESAVQANVIGNSVTVTTVLCASNAAAAAAVQQPGELRTQYAGEPARRGQLLVGYRIPAGVTAPPTIATNVPSIDENGSPITVTDHVHAERVVHVGPRVAPAARRHRAVGRLRVADAELHRRRGPQTLTLTPTLRPSRRVRGSVQLAHRRRLPLEAVRRSPDCPSRARAPFPGVSYLRRP